MEVPPRFELGRKGFADLGLTTWLWYRINLFLSNKTVFGNLRKEPIDFCRFKRTTNSNRFLVYHIIFGHVN